MMPTSRFLIFTLCALFSTCSFAQSKADELQKNNNIIYTKPYSVFFFYGKMTNKLLRNVLRFDVDTENATLYSAEVGYQLPKDNVFNGFVHTVLHANLGLELNGTYQDDPQGNIYEVNPYLKFSWINFPWNKYLLTTFSIGEGISYATKVSDRELISANNASDAKRFLNYLAFDLAFALPSHPNIQLSYHIHHRSGCYGLYRSSHSGSTATGIGIRYLF